MENQLPKVALVGRANVGKSTLFNRLIEKSKALVSDVSGTTRDRNIDISKWQGREFELTDTGGLDIDKKHPGEIEKQVVAQANLAIKNSDLILFVVDIKAGILPSDKDLANALIKKGLKNKIILVANKADSLKQRQLEGDLYKLNLGEPIMVSGANGSGCGDLMDLIMERLPAEKTKARKEKERAIKIAILGKPNVGKSSLLNAILGEDRVIVTDIAHTTRESQDMEFYYQDHRFILIDTAGIRKHAKITPRSLERKSVDKSLFAIKEADVVLFVTEVQQRINSQDKKITQAILEESKPMIMVANKWDLIDDKDTNTVNKFKEYYQNEFPYIWWAPLIFISAKSGQRARKILDLVLEIKKSAAIEISQSQLDRFLKSKIKQHRPSRGKGLKNPYIYKIEQVRSNPPRFIIHVNDPLTLHFSYIRFLQNNLREQFQIIGTPIQIEVIRWKQPKEK
ncbi:MAG: ribosome biogenesis GTPase Der [Patescibacteria group bacterium]|jgi:GTP-binding protein